MKARIKKTGQIVDVFLSEKYANMGKRFFRENEDSAVFYVESDLDFKDTIDWGQRRYEIAREILSARIINSGFHDTKIPVEYADKLIEELKK